MPTPMVCPAKTIALTHTIHEGFYCNRHYLGMRRGVQG